MVDTGAYQCDADVFARKVRRLDARRATASMRRLGEPPEKPTTRLGPVGLALFRGGTDWRALAAARGDIHALGATPYALLAGVPPYSSDSPARRIAAQRSGPPPALSSLRRERVAPELADVVLRCLDPDPHERFRSVAELAAALTPFADDNAWSRVDAELADPLILWPFSARN